MPLTGIPNPRIVSIFAGPIRITEFRDAFRRTLPFANRWLLRRPRKRGPKIGLAVSGGVDSMALAALCHVLRLGLSQAHDTFQAFVVDHKARVGSETEAYDVASRLNTMGLPSQVLTLQWPPGVNPAELTNFESRARTLRYQALGLACRDQGIGSLLLAHHEDDQAETVLMRLADGHTGIGLQGIQSSTEIPECFGIHGVHRSSTVSHQGVARGHKQLSKVNLDNAGYGNSQDEAVIGLERHGIKVYRPLLSFSKKRLEATCLRLGTTWTEDVTNKDPTLGPRNVARSLLEQGRLPRALQKPSLLTLAAKTMFKVVECTTIAEKEFAKCQILILDLRSGGMIVRLPRRNFAVKSLPEEYTGNEIGRRKFIFASLLRRIIDLITPLEKTTLHGMALGVDHIFPELGKVEYNDLDRHLLDPAISVAGVNFQRLVSPLPESDPRKSHKANALDPDYIWMLTRQPPTASFRESYFITIPPTNNSLPQAPTNSSRPNPVQPRPGWSSWHLFDGRYWIQVLNNTSHSITLRFFAEADTKPFRLSLSNKTRRHFDAMIKAVAPGKVRYTLPALVGGDGLVWALPSIGVARDGLEGKCQWEIRYKKIDIGTHDPKVVYR
ncbi:MAG: hypothetical protein M1835_005842 [Candelina submexicana]|nr:MAG: hypothetical protein M1835_005842 [Candelina submexicana]